MLINKSIIFIILIVLPLFWLETSILAQKNYSGSVKTYEYELIERVNGKDSLILNVLTSSLISKSGLRNEKTIVYEQGELYQMELDYHLRGGLLIGNLIMIYYKNHDQYSYEFYFSGGDSTNTNEGEMNIRIDREGKVLINEIYMHHHTFGQNYIYSSLSQKRINELIEYVQVELKSNEIMTESPTLNYSDFIPWKVSVDKKLVVDTNNYLSTIRYHIDTIYRNGHYLRRDSVCTYHHVTSYDSVNKVLTSKTDFPDDLSWRHEEFLVDSLKNTKEQFAYQLFIRDTVFSISLKSHYEGDTCVSLYSVKGHWLNSDGFFKIGKTNPLLRPLSVCMDDSIYTYRKFWIRKDKNNCILSANGYAITKFGDIVEMKVNNPFHGKTFEHGNPFFEILEPADFYDSLQKRKYNYPSVLDFFPNMNNLSFSIFRSILNDFYISNRNCYVYGNDCCYPFIDPKTLVNFYKTSPEDKAKLEKESIEATAKYYKALDKKQARDLSRVRIRAKRKKISFRSQYEIPRKAREKKMNKTEGVRTFVHRDSENTYKVYEVVEFKM